MDDYKYLGKSDGVHHWLTPRGHHVYNYSGSLKDTVMMNHFKREDPRLPNDHRNAMPMAPATRDRLLRDIRQTATALNRRVLDLMDGQPEHFMHSDLRSSEVLDQCQDIARHAETLCRLVLEYQK